MLSFLWVVSPVRAVVADSLAEIIADQPGMTLSASTVSAGHVQTEMRFGFFSAGAGNQFVLPDLLIRIGANDHFEARLSLPSLVIRSIDGAHPVIRNGGESGVFPVGDRAYKRPLSFTIAETNLSLGTKGIWQVAEDWLLGAAVELSLPVYNQEFQDWMMTTIVHGILGWCVNDYTTLEGNVSLWLTGPSDYGHKWWRTYSAAARLRGFFARKFQYFLEFSSLFWEHYRPYPALSFGFDARMAREFSLGTFMGAGLVNIHRFTDVFVGISVAIHL